MLIHYNLVLVQNLVPKYNLLSQFVFLIHLILLLQINDEFFYFCLKESNDFVNYNDEIHKKIKNDFDLNKNLTLTVLKCMQKEKIIASREILN